MPGIYAPSTSSGALRQGEIITSLSQGVLSLDTVGTDSPEMENVFHPFAIVLSQDCDLEQDWRDWRACASLSDPGVAQRQLPSVLFAQVNTATGLRGNVVSDIWRRVKINKDERYHFLEAVPSVEDSLGEGLEELGIDFKRYFTLPTGEVYKRLEQSAKRRCRLVSPYLEHLSTRFCYFQFRVALPLDHQSG